VKKKWSRDRTRRTYVESEENIGLRTIAKRSGNAQSTVAKWSSEDNWVAERKQYWNALRAATTEKTIDSISDRLAESRSEVAVRHFNRYKKLGDLAELLVSLKTNQLTQVVRTGDKKEIDKAIARVDMTTLNFLSLISDRSCKGEAGSIGLKFDIDNDALVKVAESLGYSLVETNYLKETRS
jgi:hypothetical protein